MFNFIARNFSSLGSMLAAPFRAAWRLICRWFPERDFTVMDTPTGNLYSYHQSTFWRFARSFGKFTLVIWASWSTYVFMYHRPMLQSRTRQLDEMRAVHNRHMSDLNIYHKKFTELTRELNVIDDQITQARREEGILIAENNSTAKSGAANKDAKNTNAKTKDNSAKIDDLIRKRLNVWAQLDLLQDRLGNMFTDEKFSPDFKRLSELSMEYDLTNAENNRLRALNQEISEAAQSVYDADNQILDRVSKMTDENYDFLSKELKKISSTLAALGLNEQKLSKNAAKAENSIVGAAVTPMNFDANLDPKYQQLADKIDLWHGLFRARKLMPLGAPVERVAITSRYGIREHPIDGNVKSHKGIDFQGAIGTPLFAVAPGRVTFAGDRIGYGKTVEIDHGLGFTTLYAHLSKINVRRGDNVSGRQIVGLAGNSGRSTGPHLHYEIRYNGMPFDPLSFVKSK